MSFLNFGNKTEWFSKKVTDYHYYQKKIQNKQVFQFLFREFENRNHIFHDISDFSQELISFLV